MAACKWVKVSASGISAKSSSMPQLVVCSTTTEDCLLNELACCTNGQAISLFPRVSSTTLTFQKHYFTFEKGHKNEKKTIISQQQQQQQTIAEGNFVAVVSNGTVQQYKDINIACALDFALIRWMKIVFALWLVIYWLDTCEVLPIDFPCK